MPWCADFQKGYEAQGGCGDNGKEMIFGKDKLACAKSFCEGKAECFGVAKHPNEKYTPRCKQDATSSSTKIEWLNKNNCIQGNVKPLTWSFKLFSHCLNVNFLLGTYITIFYFYIVFQ